MTLIVPFCSKDFVALASDRRITLVQTGRAVGWEDTENKAVVLAGHFLMGYTGLARLGGVKTEEWVVDKLAGVEDPNDYWTTLADEAKAAIDALGYPRELSGHAFVGVGYAGLDDERPELQPFGLMVSNALGAGGYGTWEPGPDFAVERTPALVADDDFRITAYGMSPPREVIEEAVERIQTFRKRHPGKTIGVLQEIVELVRRVGDQCDAVSKDVSIFCPAPSCSSR